MGLTVGIAALQGVRSELPALSAKSTSISSPKACARKHRPRFLLIVSSFTRGSFVSRFKQHMTTVKVDSASEQRLTFELRL